MANVGRVVADLGDKQPKMIEDRIWEPGIIQREEADTGRGGIK